MVVDCRFFLGSGGTGVEGLMVYADCTHLLAVIDRWLTIVKGSGLTALATFHLSANQPSLDQ